MGVTGLWKLIEQSGKPVPLDTLENKVLAVDISIWLHQVIKGFQDSNGATLPNAHLLGLFHRLCKLMYYRIKPVFVFDGGVPPLKRETIAKRAKNKNKYQSEADKLQQLLLEALAKEKVVQQALGPSTSELITSPKKPVNQKPLKQDDEDDLFKLPPIQENPTDDSLTDLTESDDSFNEKHRSQYNQNLHSIDVKSSYFQSLPADIRHEILSDMKETRKQSSWGRLHELPVESQSFSSFQMKRLLKRRLVQVELQEAEKEMGGKGLSMAELENLLSEEGVVDPDIATERIASNEQVRYLHVRDITKAMKKEADDSIKEEPKCSTDELEYSDKLDAEADIKIEDAFDEDLDLQKAIQLSLGYNVDEIKSNSYNENSNEAVQLTKEQRKAFGTAATSLARSYMIEYGGMNDDDIADLVKLDETLHTQSEFKFNDDSILIGRENENQVVPSTSYASEDKSLDISGEISSDADSDFIDVPEMDSDVDNIFLSKSKMPLPPAFLMNEPPKLQQANDFQHKDLIDESNKTKIEVVINPGEMRDIEDDIFADIFSKPEPIEILEENPEPVEISEEEPVYVVEDDQIDKNEKHTDEVCNSVSSQKDTNQKTNEETEKSLEKIETKIDASMKSILNELNNEISSVKKLSLDDLLSSKPISDSKSQSNKQLAASSLNGIIFEEPSTPPKIPQPFFVKKTPPSSKKKSPSNNNHELELTPSKASKSLLDAFDSIPSTSSATTKIDEQETMKMAANVLRDQKSKEELEEIAEQLNQERRDLVAERNKKDRLGVSITEQMSAECMELLRLFGVPYIIAPMEAEAQCAFLNEINLTDGTITDDSDIWLFGGRTVYKNFFDQNKLVMEYKSINIEKLFHLDRPKLIQLSFLVGSDYTQGIHGVGAVTALEVLSIFSITPEKEGETTETMSILSSLRKFRDWWQHKNITQRTNALRNKLKNITITEDFPNPRVVDAYLFPTVDENREKFAWGQPELEILREYARKNFGWTKKRTDEIIIPVIKRLNEKMSQKTIQNYFKITDVASRKDLKVSKRVREALELMTADPNSPMPAEETVEKKRVKKKTAKKVEKDSDIDSGNTAEKKPKRIRKRKNIESIEEKTGNDIQPEPSTSFADVSTVNVGSKKIVLPNNNAPIPQREKDKQIMESNKLKAIEILKQMKTNSRKK